MASSQPAQEQPAVVVQGTSPVAQGAPARPAPASPHGEVQACTMLVGTIREIVSEVSVAYNDYERTHDLAAFERKVRESGSKATGLGLQDPRLQSIASRYREALLLEVQAARHAATAGPLSAAASEQEGRGAVAQEGELLDELNAYCSWQAREAE